MTWLEKIRNMSGEELASFLIVSGETIDVDYDEDDCVKEVPTSVWYTPFRTFPGWYSREEVVEKVCAFLGMETDFNE